MVATKKAPMASRNKSALLYEKRSTKEKTKNSRISKSTGKFGGPAEDAKITKLEEALVIQAANPTTLFDQIIAVSNPGITTPLGLTVLEVWWETYRTIEREAINQIIRLTQEVIVGTNIISAMSNEEDARRQCYGLVEQLEERFVGFMPELGDTIEVIFPMHDLDASFVHIEESGNFILNVMWSLTWQIAKGSKP